jgi:putative tryptophan/tyrosine transport system substrate-binding protein
MTNHLRRREFITLLGGAAAWPRAARAQQANAVKRIGWLASTDDSLSTNRSTVFEAELARLGWSIGRNLEIEYRLSAADNTRLRAYAAELVAKAPDVITCTGTLPTSILKQLTSTIPVVFQSVADPVASGFVASLARPGGNMTGFISVEHSLAGKWVSVLRDIAPDVGRALVLYDPENTNWTGYLPVAEAAGMSLRVKVSAVRVSVVGDIERAIEAFTREPQQGGMITLPGSAMMSANRQAIADLAIRHRLPAIYPFDYFAESGGLVAYGPETDNGVRGAASYVARILRGIKPADLPVQAPVKFELVINLKAAKAIGLDIPYNVLLLADRLIE